MNRKRIDYSGQKVNVGIDVHKKTYSVCCLWEGQIVKKATIPGFPQALIDFLNGRFNGAEIHSAYEAGFSGFVLHRELIAEGINNIVVNPASIEVASNDKVKTDKRDAKKIAIQLAAGRLGGIYIPTVKQEEERLLTRTRDQLVSERTRAGQRFKSRLYQFGLIPFDDDTVTSERFIDEYLKKDLPKRLKDSLEVLSRLWKFVDKEIKSLDKEMKKQAAKDKHELTYRSVPGIGDVSSRELSNELGDMSQFHNERAIFKHTGLTPSEFSSGESTRQGHISGQGSSRLRWILTEASWIAIGKDPVLGETFNRIALKRGKKRAIVAIARKLIGRIRACFRKGVSYELGYGIAA